MKRFKKKFAARKSFDRLDDQSQSEQEKKRPSDLKRGGSSTTKTTTSSNSGRSIGKSRTKASASPKGKDRTKGASVSSPYKNDTNSSYSSTSSSLINSNRTKSAKSPSGPSTKRTLLKSLRPAPISSLPYLSQGLTPFEYDSFTPNSDHSHSVSHNHSINLDNSNSSNNNSIFTSQNYMSQRARTNWDVQDSKLNPIPPFHPPISPIYATYVGDTSSTPSIIASRISECLRKRSMVVEFDSDSANPTATCLNQDGVLFVICLYRGSKGVPMYTNTNTSDHNLSGSSSSSQHERGSSSKSPRTRSSMSSYSPLHHSFDIGGVGGYGDSRNLNSSSNSNTQQTQTQNHPDFSNGVIVECTKIRGDLISFHRDCRQILSCTSGDSDGLDDLRSPNCAMLQSPHGFGYKRWQAKKPFGILKTEEILQCEPDVFPSLINVRAMNRNMNVNMNSPTRINVTTNNNADPSSPRSTTSSNSRYSSSSSYTASSKSPRTKTNTNTRNKKHFTHATYEALGKVLANLENERVDARLLAMESLIMLTDTKSSGIERAYLASLCVLGSSSSSTRRKWDSVGVGVGAFEGKLSPLHERVVLLAMGKFKQTTLQPHLMAGHDSDGHLNEYGDGADVNGEHGEHGNIFTNDSNTNANTHNRNRTPEIDMNLHIHNDDDLDTDTCDSDIIKEYNIQIRRYAMHALTNALSNLLHHHESFPLLPKPNCEEFMTQEFLERLGDDLRGATRPPMASLGSAHEATYAARFIHLIAGYSEDGFRFVNGAVVGMTTGVPNTNVGTSVNNNPSSPSPSPSLLSTSRSLFGLLDRARVAGSACHRALELECQLAQAAIAIGDKM